MSALLEARGVSKAFAGVRAVDDASLAVEPASITALIGPNGAGKSTLFNCISGFLRPDNGRIELAGQRIDRRPAARDRPGRSRTDLPDSSRADPDDGPRQRPARGPGPSRASTCSASSGAAAPSAVASGR